MRLDYSETKEALRKFQEASGQSGNPRQGAVICSVYCRFGKQSFSGSKLVNTRRKNLGQEENHAGEEEDRSGKEGTAQSL